MNLAPVVFLQLVLALSLAALVAAVIGQGPSSGGDFTSFTLYEQQVLWTPSVATWNTIFTSVNKTAGNFTVSTGVLPVPGSTLLQTPAWVS